MDANNTANAECQLTKSDNNVTKVSHESGILYFSPETEEIIVVPGEEAGDFEAHCLEMVGCVDEFHQAKHDYSLALEKYGQQKAQTDVSMPAQSAEVVAAEESLQQKREALLDKLRDGEASNMGYQDVVELLPLLDTRKRGPGNQRLGRRYTYASQRYYSERAGGRSQAGAKKKWHSVTLKNRDTATGSESIYSVDSQGRRKIDTKKLAKQLTTEILPVIKAELKDYVDLSDYNLDKTLFDWATTWNDSLYGSGKFIGIDVSGAAQFMRFISNVGASAEYDPNQGSVKIKGEAKASISLASGIGNAEFYIPDRLGWDLSFLPKQTPETAKSGQPVSGFNLGTVRIFIENQLIGFVGASALVESQFQVVVKDKKQQIVAGQPQGRLPRFRERQSGSSSQFYNQMKDKDEGLTASIEGFAGISAEYAVKGAIQWLKPTPPTVAGNATLPKTVGSFTDLATIGTSIAGLAGIGAGAQFWCTYINGKFCFKVAASLCCGVGAKGAFICEVGVSGFQEFASWLAYQLFTLDYRFFALVDKSAFETFTRFCVMQMADLGEKVYEVYNKEKLQISEVLDAFNSKIKNIVDESKKNTEASKKRTQLARNIIAHSETLLTYTPEAKGILLYLLTRHAKEDHFDTENRKHFLLDIYPDRKEAVIRVLRSIQTRREWQKVMCHRNQDGHNLVEDQPSKVVEVVEQQVQQLRDFLQEGFNRDQEMSRIEAELLLKEIQQRLKDGSQLSVGYALAMNDTRWYDVTRVANPHFPQRCEFGPCEATISQMV